MAALGEPQEVTRLLLAWNQGDESALEKLVPQVYQELRRLAKRQMRREHPDHTLQTTALINPRKPSSAIGNWPRLGCCANSVEIGDMEPERWSQIEKLYHSAAALQPARPTTS